MDSPDITQLPGAGSVSQPASGTYGAGAAVDKLKQGMGLQPTQGEPPPGPNISTTPGAAKPQVSSGPFGLPPAITAPTQQPNTPVSTPLAAPVNPVAQAGMPSQQRIALLDMLSRNPDVSDATREWAQTVVAKLIEASHQ